jgi:hypothetical protein
MPTGKLHRFDNGKMRGKQLIDAAMKSRTVYSRKQEHRPPKALQPLNIISVVRDRG